MCGIAGIARLDGRALEPTADGLLDRMADILEHRGPDDRATTRQGPVGMAFTRLSLVDPLHGGQPLVSDDGDLVLIANGEVYNYRELAASLPAGTRLRTQSDCEVLLYLYREHGVRFLDKVRGMFGIILWDRKNNDLILARDRFGIKPLYYHRDAQRIVLGSELKALFADAGTPRRFNWERALTNPYLSSAAGLHDRPLDTWFEGLESVPAATILRIDLDGGATTTHRYWQFPSETVPQARAEDLIQAYGQVLAESVRECSTADTEIGLFLSGGIDSAAVMAHAVGEVDQLHTFSVLSASTYLNGDAEHAHRLAQKFGVPNHQVVFDPARVPSPEDWQRLVWLCETPMCGPEMYYKHELHRFAKQLRPDLRAMLLGAASDEFNGGYSSEFSAGEGWAVFEANVRSMARQGDLRRRPELSTWWASTEQPLITDAAVEAFAGADLADPYLSYLEWEYRKIQQYNVWHEDRTAAGSGIEARVPFLDHRLVEISASIPANLRPELLWDKTILRKAMRGVLPETTVQRPKGPFFYGPGTRHTYQVFVKMLLQQDGALIERALAGTHSSQFLNGDALRQELTRFGERPTDSPYLELALRVVNMGLLSQLVEQLPAPTAATPQAAPPIELAVSDWAQPGIEEAVGLCPTWDLDSVPRLAPEVLLLTRPDTAEWFVAVNGSIEFVLDEDEPHIRQLLQSIDGVRSLREILDQLGSTVTDLSDTLTELSDQNLLLFG